MGSFSGVCVVLLIPMQRDQLMSIVDTLQRLRFSSHAANDVSHLVQPPHSFDVARFVPRSAQSITSRVDLNGVVPMNYMGNMYRTPVSILIESTYPSKPPTVYLQPIQGMEVDPRCPFARASDGLVLLDKVVPVWDPKAMNSQRLVSQLSQAFGQHPPLYQSRPKDHPQQPQQSQQYSSVTGD